MLTLHDSSEADARQHAAWQMLTCCQHTASVFGCEVQLLAALLSSHVTSELDSCARRVVNSSRAAFDHFKRC